MEDMTHTTVQPGDCLLDSRGHVHEARETDPTINVSGVIYTYEVSPHRNGKLQRGNKSYVEQGFCVLARPEDLTTSQENRKLRYQEVFQQGRSAELDEYIAARRAIIRDLHRRYQTAN